MHDVAIAPEGKSLGRRIVDYPLVAMLIAVFLFLITTIIAGILAKFFMPPISGFSFEMEFDVIAIPLLIILYELVIRRLGEHPRDDYRDRRAVPHLLMGVALGFLVFSAAVGLAAAIGIYHLRGTGDLTGMLPALIAAAAFPAVSEEMLFRGIFFRWLEEWGGSWAGLIISSALFGAAHSFNPGSSVIATSFIAIEAGLLLGGAYMLTRSLWFPMGIHAAWNFTQGEIFDIPVSGLDQHGLVQAKLDGPPLLTGGSFGLEASVLTLVIAAGIGAWIVWLAVCRGELVQPRWVRNRHLAAA